MTSREDIRRWDVFTLGNPCSICSTSDNRLIALDAKLFRCSEDRSDSLRIILIDIGHIMIAYRYIDFRLSLIDEGNSRYKFLYSFNSIIELVLIMVTDKDLHLSPISRSLYIKGSIIAVASIGCLRALSLRKGRCNLGKYSKSIHHNTSCRAQMYRDSFNTYIYSSGIEALALYLPLPGSVYGIADFSLHLLIRKAIHTRSCLFIGGKIDLHIRMLEIRMKSHVSYSAHYDCNPCLIIRA